MDNWKRSAAKYLKEKEPAVKVVPVDESTQDGEKQTLQQKDIDQAVCELERFMSSEDGRDAMALLRASRRHIVFAEENEGGGFGVVYFIDGNGLHRSVEAMGTWTVCSSDVPKPNISSIDAWEVVMSSVRIRGLKPEDIMTWLYGELDKIAKGSF